MLIGKSSWMSFLPKIPWLNKGLWVVVDQAFFAGTNFLVGVILARWLQPADYGSFSASYAVLTLVVSVYTPLWIEPMLVYGPLRYMQNFENYLSAIRALHWKLSTLLAITFSVFAIFFFFIAKYELAVSFFSLASAVPAVLYLWLIRRAAYALLKPHLAAFASAVYLLLYISGVYYLMRVGSLSAMLSFFAMSAAAFLSALYTQWRLFSSKNASHVAQEKPVLFREIVFIHWNYGKWALLSALFAWVPTHIYYIYLPILQGLELSASLRALINLPMPALQVGTALSSFLLPLLARERKSPDLFIKKFSFSITIFIALSLLYGTFIYVYGDKITFYLYSGRYNFDKALFTYIAFFPILFNLISILSVSLKSLEMPHLIAYTWSFTAALAILSLVYVTFHTNLTHVVLTILLLLTVNVALMGFLAFRALRRWGKVSSERKVGTNHG